MEAQLKLDLHRTIHAEDGNSTVPASFRLPGILISALEIVAKRASKEKGKLIAEYVIEGLMRDVGQIAMTDLHSNEKLKNILPRG